jgi:Na+/H+-dicarboxylate symporter
LVEQRTEFSFLEQYIPTNIFSSLATNIVPAVVVFCLALGISLMVVQRKEKAVLIELLHTLSQSLVRISGAVAQLAPIGVFAIIASVSGTLSVEDFGRLQIFVFSYLVIALVLTFWVLPGLAARLTPVSYKELFRASKDALVTAFATGSVFVVLPLLARQVEELLISKGGDREETGSTVGVVVPTSLSFPSSGKLLMLAFVPFAGWLSSSMVPLSQMPQLAVTGFFSFFGSTYQAIPYLLNMFQIPSDTFQFMPVVDNLVGLRFGTLLAAMHTLVVGLVAASAVAGLAKIAWRKVAVFAAISSFLLVGPLLGLRLVYENLFEHEYQEYNIFVGMGVREPVRARLFRETMPPSLTGPAGLARTDQIKQRGFLRVGYFRDALPYAYINDKGQASGFDVEMAHRLARDLGVDVEFVLIARDRLEQAFDANIVDVVMSGMGVTPSRASRLRFSVPYLEHTLAFVVRDYRREAFGSRDRVKSMNNLKIAVPDEPYYRSMIQAYLPDAEMVPVRSAREFLARETDDIDALLYSAEAGSAWCLVYPNYSVAVPHPDVIALPLAYAVDRRNSEFVEFLNTWIDLKKRDQTIDELFRYWIQGQDAAPRQPRWSVIRNVLGWVE